MRNYNLRRKRLFIPIPKKTVIYIIVNRFQIGKMKRIVHEFDPLAYVTITEVADVFSANN